MVGELKVTVLEVDRTVIELDADSVTALGVGGELTILPGHEDIMTPLGVGLLVIASGNENRKVTLHSGFLRVSDNEVVVLADAAESPDEIDIERARKAKERAEGRLVIRAEDKESDTDFARAEAALKRALIRIKLAGRVTDMQ